MVRIDAAELLGSHRQQPVRPRRFLDAHHGKRGVSPAYSAQYRLNKGAHG